MHSKLKIIVYSLLLATILLPLVTTEVWGADNPAPISPSAPQTSSCPDGRFCLNVPIGNVTDLAKDESLGAYIRLWYGFIIGTVGIVATVVMMIAGLIWLTSAGISGRVGLAKDMMKSGIIGLLIAFFSYTILYIINPNLTVISLPELKTVSGDINTMIHNSPSTVSNQPTQQAQRATQVKPELNAGLNCITQNFGSYRITSTVGGSHTPNSCHYIGLAADVVFDGMNNSETFNKFKAAAQKCGIGIYDERTNPGHGYWTGPHLHLKACNCVGGNPPSNNCGY